MNYDDKILQILKNSKLRHRLSEIGIYPSVGLQKVIGPTGSM